MECFTLSMHFNNLNKYKTATWEQESGIKIAHCICYCYPAYKHAKSGLGMYTWHFTSTHRAKHLHTRTHTHTHTHAYTTHNHHLHTELKSTFPKGMFIVTFTYTHSTNTRQIHFCQRTQSACSQIWNQLFPQIYVIFTCSHTHTYVSINSIICIPIKTHTNACRHSPPSPPLNTHTHTHTHTHTYTHAPFVQVGLLHLTLTKFTAAVHQF